MKEPINGKICLVTGGTGKATAQALAQLGTTVVIAGRDASKTAQLVAEIRAASGLQSAWLCTSETTGHETACNVSHQQADSAPHNAG